MPPTQRRPDPSVIDRLLREPQQFGFFQAVRVLDRWLSAGASDGKGLAKVQFRNSLALSFPPSEIEALKVHARPAMPAEEIQVAETPAAAALSPEGEPSAWADSTLLAQVLAARAPASTLLPQHEVSHVELTPAFMGLLGVAGTLPFHYTEQLAHRELYQKDMGARAFMDIFTHRAVTLFYEAWRKHRLPFQFEADRHQRYMPLVLSLAGLGHRGLRDRLGGAQGGVADEALAYFAGALQQRTRSAPQLQQMLQQYLGVPVQVEQFVGRWYALPAEHMPLLGGGRKPAILGRTTSLGERVWQRDLRMRLVLGPLPHRKFLRFLPGGSGAHALKELLTLYSGVGLEYEVNLRLQQADVRGFTLDSRRPTQVGRLGWDTFLQTTPANDNRADVRYDIHAA